MRRAFLAWLAVSGVWVGATPACGAAEAPAAGSGGSGGAPDSGGGGGDAAPDAAPEAPIDAGPPLPLQVQAFGVQGFLLRLGAHAVLTAPLFTRQSTVAVALNLPLSADTPAIDQGLLGADLSGLGAIISGHAHYDHLMDVPHVMGKAPASVLYANRTARNIFAALAPDRAPGCAGTPPSQPIERSRVVALDDPLASHVDYTFCPEQRPAGAPLEGTWVTVPGHPIRVLPVCTTHPDQIGPIHFGEGAIDTELCALPAAAAGWLEGQTLSFLVDFLDDTGRPAFRIYYQDAPATRPIGEVPPTLLAERRVDLALLCVGSNDAVQNQPTDVIAALRPRFVLSGHWEDFFIGSDQPPQPILLLDVDNYVARAEAALAEPADAPLEVDGVATSARHVLVSPGSRFRVPPLP